MSELEKLEIVRKQHIFLTKQQNQLYLIMRKLEIALKDGQVDECSKILTKIKSQVNLKGLILIPCFVPKHSQICFPNEDVRVKKVDLLLSHGADVNDRLSYDDFTVTNLACESGLLQIVKLLEYHGGSVIEPSKHGRTPLMSASHKGRDKIVEFLLSKGVNINTKDKGGNDAIMIACRHNRHTIAEILLSMGANIHHKSRNVFGYAPNSAPHLVKHK